MLSVPMNLPGSRVERRKWHLKRASIQEVNEILLEHCIQQNEDLIFWWNCIKDCSETYANSHMGYKDDLDSSVLAILDILDDRLNELQLLSQTLPYWILEPKRESLNRYLQETGTKLSKLDLSQTDELVMLKLTKNSIERAYSTRLVVPDSCLKCGLLKIGS
jgi:hypothetical protein